MFKSLLLKKINKTVNNSKVIDIDNKTKIIIFSDCHRGHGDRSDDFFHNQHVYINSLKHYMNKGFTYIELGDGDELWENANFKLISERYRDIYQIFDKFHREKKFRFIWGNHNRRWKNSYLFNKYFGRIVDEKSGKKIRILEGLESEEAIILRLNGDKSKEILLIHGHQGEFLNDTLWWFGRFFIRVFWRFFQMRFGIADPTSPAKNFKIRRKIDKRFMEIAEILKKGVIIGHTHFPVFPDYGDVPYFNDGSCVHPRCITGIEIENGNIILVKWLYAQDNTGSLKLRKENISKSLQIEKLLKYFNRLPN